MTWDSDKTLPGAEITGTDWNTMVDVIDAKAGLSSPTFTGTTTVANLVSTSGSTTTGNLTSSNGVFAGTITSGGVAVPTISSSDTLSNKTLTAPKIENNGFIADANGNESLNFVTTSSAVNNIQITNTATGSSPIISAVGDDANLAINLQQKGSAYVGIRGSSTSQGKLRIFEDTDNGTDYIQITTPAAISAGRSHTLPDASDGTFLLDTAADLNNNNITEIKQACFNGVIDDGNSSTADTIDWSTGSIHKSTLTGNVTYTFTAPTGVSRLTLLIYTGGSAYTVTWPAAVKWTGGTAPTITTTASKVDICTFLYDGTNYWGTYSQNYTA
jgi:hypothetical protein